MQHAEFKFLEYLLDCIDSVESGKKGAISENNKLNEMYDHSYYGTVQKHLMNGSERVKIELILFLTRMKERQAYDDIKELRIKDRESVSAACLAFINVMDTKDKDVPDLIDTLRHRNGEEFMMAAAKMGNVGGREDIPALREVYGQTKGDMRTAVRMALDKITDRYDDLRPKKYLILSEPVYPNEEAFMKFLDNSSTYLDIRYRDNIFDLDEISEETYINIARAIKKIQIRLYNEKANLKYYEKEAKKGYSEVEDLLIWAADDLKTKKISGRKPESDNHKCPECGSKMIFVNEHWHCTECSFRD